MSKSLKDRFSFPKGSALLRSGGWFADPEDDDFRADRRAVVEIDDVLVRQADAAGRNIGANGPGFIGAVKGFGGLSHQGRIEKFRDIINFLESVSKVMKH